LRFGVFYVDAEGEMVAVASGLREPAYRWHTVADGPNDDPRVVIVATDGLNDGVGEADLGFGIGVNAERDGPSELPEVNGLGSNYPNPFWDRTTLAITSSRAVEAEITVYDVLGRRVRSQTVDHLQAGLNYVPFNRDGLMPGVYFFVVEGDELFAVGRMVVAG
jgi:hypothetical protein